MQFRQLAETLAILEVTSSRNEITRILTEVFAKSQTEEIDKICYLLLGELLPAYRGVEFNLAEKTMIQVLAAAYRISPEQAGKIYKKQGDLGQVVEQVTANLAVPTRRALSVTAVYERLLALTGESGLGSQERRIKQLAALLTELDFLSAKFVVRIPVGKLRLGFSEATILDGLSWLVAGNKSARPAIERAYNVTADIGLIAKHLKSGGLDALAKLSARPGIPIRPALAERLPQTAEIIQKLGPRVAVEPKLDGFRIAIHRWSEDSQDRVALFSRNLENTTAMFPEIAAAVSQLAAADFILDGEAIGFNPATGRFAPFQETMQRKRKYDIEAMAKKVPLTVFVFDVLYLDGRSLLDQPFSARRSRLEKLFAESRLASSLPLKLSAQKSTDQATVLDKELAAALKKGLEGIVVKNLTATYQAGSRGFHWIKLKAGTAALGERRAGQAASGLADTVDCLVLGAYRGRGARAKFGVGGFLLGLRGEDGRFYSLTRLGSGLSEAQFKEAKKRIAALKVAAPPALYSTPSEIAPDVWLAPALVAEVLADEITPSPRHTSGYSLRFPRLVRWRDDKGPAEVTTVAELKKLL